MRKTVFQGTVDYIQVMDESGAVDSSLLPAGLEDSKIAEMYKFMSFTRALDAKCISLQRQGRLATYAPSLGEEATQVGSAMALRPDDIFVPSFRQHGTFLVRGLPLDLFFLYWKGMEDGCRIPPEVKGLPYIVPVSTQVPHAVGIAFAQKYMKRDRAVIVYLGDGGTSEGDFYEAMNFAGVFKVPLVTIIENNQWAISVPLKVQTASETLAQKGIAAGLRCVQVDGNDVIGVYKAVGDAIQNSKDGATLIECVTYRMTMHTTSDDPTKYRSDEEVAMWAKRDPISRVRAYLSGKGLWNDSLEAQMQDDYKKQIDAGVEKAEAFKQDPKSVFDNVYSSVPQVLKAEYEEAAGANFWLG